MAADPPPPARGEVPPASEPPALVVDHLTKQNASLVKQAQSLQQPATIQRQARILGMVRAGEHPYVVTGLPNR